MIRLLTCFLLFATYANSTECFHPERDADINFFLTPNVVRVNRTKFESLPKLKETEAVIGKIHSKIREAYKTYNLDPRLIYARMLGESTANPFQHQIGGGGAYGLFQFTGDAVRVRAKCDRAQHPRLCQVEYYVDEYMKRFAKHANTGCMKTSWENYSMMNKYSYLNAGTCGGRMQTIEYNQCKKNQNYQWTGACRLISEVFNWKAPHDDKKIPQVPLCEDYKNPQRAEPLHHMDKAGPGAPLTI